MKGWRVVLLVPALGLVLSAQDAGMVLRTSVGYRTQRNSAPLTDEQKKEADQLAAEGAKLGGEGKYGEAMRAYYHGIAVMRGLKWTPEFEFAAALQARLEHALVEPGKQVAVSFSALYPASNGGQKLSASLFLV